MLASYFRFQPITVGKSSNRCLRRLIISLHRGAERNGLVYACLLLNSITIQFKTRLRKWCSSFPAGSYSHKPAHTPTWSRQFLTESLLTGESGLLVHPSSTWTQTHHCKRITQSVSSASQSNQILNNSNTLKFPISIIKWKPRYVLPTYNKWHRINIYLQYWGSSPETHTGYSSVQVTLSCIPTSHC